MFPRIVCLVLAFALAAPGAALADKPKKDKKKTKDKDVEVNVDVTIVFAHQQREAVQSFFVKKHGRGHCPPGLAKKGNGCLPPGQAKKRYAVGQPLPADIRVDVIPHELEVRLGPPPRGYRYCIVDGDLVKLAVGTMLVVDAIEGLVN